MKQIYAIHLIAFLLLLTGNIIGQQTQNLKLVYDKDATAKFEINALLIKTGGTTTDRKGELTVITKFSFVKNEPVIILTFKTDFVDKNDKLITFDKEGDFNEVIWPEYEKVTKKKRLTRENVFVKNIKSAKKFYDTEDLSLNVSVKGGVDIISDKSITYQFKIKNYTNESNQNYSITFLTYYVNKDDKIESEVEPITLMLSAPDLPCNKYTSEWATLKGEQQTVSDLDKKLDETLRKNSINEIDRFLPQVHTSRDKIKSINDLKIKIEKDPLYKVCKDVKDIYEEIIKQLSMNPESGYEKIIQDCKNKKDALENVNQTSQVDPVEKPKEVTNNTEVPKPIAPDKKKDDKKIEKKQETPEETCDQIETKIKEGIKEYKGLIKKGNFDQRLASMKDECDALLRKCSQGTKNKKEKTEIENGRKDISKKINNIYKEYTNINKKYPGLEWLPRKKPDCKFEALHDTIIYYHKITEDILVQYNAINSILERLAGCSDSGSVRKISNIRNFFAPKYFKIFLQYNTFLSELAFLKNTFKSNYSSGKYYQDVKDKLLNDLKKKSNKNDSCEKIYESVLGESDKIWLDSLSSSSPMWGDTLAKRIVKISELQNNVKNQIEELDKEINRSITDSFPIAKYVLYGLGLLILLFGAYVYYNALTKRKKKINIQEPAEISSPPDAKPEVTKKAGITITKTVPVIKGKQVTEVGRGFDHVYSKIGIDYYEINLQDYWDDTLVSKVYLHRSCIKKTYKFFYESCVASGRVLETGGFIIGAWEIDRQDPNKYVVSLEDFIEPGDDAIYGEYQLNFGAKIGIRKEKVIQDYREKMGQDFTLTAWFHSHPEIKIFLSNHDLDVQERLSTLEHKYKLLALVIDPITQENGKNTFLTGVFSYKSNGTMNNNSGAMKLVRWRELYDWALSPVTPNIKDFYCIDMNRIFRDSIVSKVCFSDKSITRFSIFLDELKGNPNTIGYFKGDVINSEFENNHIVLFNDFITQLKGDEKDIVCYFHYSKNPDNVINEKYAGREAGVNPEVLIFVESVDKSISIISQKEKGKYNLSKDIIKKIPFSEIETWPTRRR